MLKHYTGGSHLLIADTELIELSKSNLCEALRRGAGLEVNGRPVRQWKTIEAAESRERRNLAFSKAVGTPLPLAFEAWIPIQLINTDFLIKKCISLVINILLGTNYN